MTELIYKAVVATTVCSEEANKLMSWCDERSISLLAGPVGGNGDRTFFVPPHGHKGYSDESEGQDASRTKLKEHLNVSDGWWWMEVEYGECDYRIIAADDGADIGTNKQS